MPNYHTLMAECIAVSSLKINSFLVDFKKKLDQGKRETGNQLGKEQKSRCIEPTNGPNDAKLQIGE